MFAYSDLIASWIFLLLGFAIVIVHFKTKYGLEFRRVTYLEQEGIVLTSEVIEAYVRHSNSGQIMNYQTNVKYSFVHEGREYVSDSLYKAASSYGSSDKLEVVAAVSKFKPGEEIIVYFEETNPENSYLLKNAPIGSTFMIVGLIFIGLGFVLQALAQ